MTNSELTHELNQADDLAINEQDLFLRHGLLALAISLVHTAVCIGFFYGGYFAAPLGTFAAIFSVIWAGNLALYSLIHSGWSQRFRDASLSLPLLIWLTIGFVWSAYYVDSFRITIVMLYFATVLLSSFRQRFLVLISVAIVASLGYFAVLSMAIMDRSMEINVTVEVVQWMIFLLTAISFAITGSAINRLRGELSTKNEQLADALERVKGMAIHDELTGLYNRRYIMDVLRQQKALADSGEYNFVICYIDLDHFKSVNDTYGHAVGDAVLKGFADTAHDVVREADYVGRLGGEEFIVVLTKTTLEPAKAVAERLRHEMESLDLSALADGKLKVTASIGMTEYRPEESIDESLARADECLYQAKDGGRNCIITEVFSQVAGQN